MDVFELAKDIPIFVVLYKHGPIDLSTRTSAVDIKFTTRTQKLLLKLLELNTGRLASSYAPHSRETKMEDAENFTLSFLIPINPLSMRNIGSLSSDIGCAVCGKAGGNRCAACHYTSYCSKNCQKAHWAVHKLECKGRTLVTGTWINVDISSSGYFGGTYVRPVNEFSTVKGGISKERPVVKSDADWPPPNIYGETPFIIKIMVPEPDMGFEPLMFYDRRRSLEFFLRIEADIKSYEALLRTTRETGYLGLRIYLYAKRLGPRKLSVCLDREPPAEAVKW